MQEFRGCVPLETTWDKKYEKSRVENGFKWSPIKSYYRKISSKGIKAGENWKIRINLTHRNGLVVTAYIGAGATLVRSFSDTFTV